MRIEVQKPFERDIEKIYDKKLAARVSAVIEELERCKSLPEIHNLKKIKSQGKYFRIRIGDYRLGLKHENNSLILLRFMHRKEIYKYFP